MKHIKRLSPLLRSKVVKDFGLGVVMGFVILTVLSAQIILETL